MCKSTFELILNYKISDLIDHLGISDDLVGVEIDHIYPKSKLKFKSIHDDSFKRAWSMDNLQLLNKEDNRKKWNKTYKTT